MNEVYYYHGTNYEETTKKIGNNVYFWWGSIEFTVAGKFNIDNDLELGISIVNRDKGDKFVKKIGRDKAYEHLFLNSILISSDRVEKYIKDNMKLPKLVIENLHKCGSTVFNIIVDKLTDGLTRKELIKLFNK